MAVETSELDTTPRSRLDELRAAFAQELDEPRLFKRFPTRRNLPVSLAGEFRLLKLDEAGDALEQGGPADTAKRILSNAIVCIHAHDPSDDRADGRGMVPLHIWAGVQELGPLQFDKRLTDVLGLPPAGTAGGTLMLLFDDNELSMAELAGALAEWSTDTTNEAYQDFTEGS